MWGSATSPFILEPFEDTGVCPVAWIEYYLSVCNLLHIMLDGGYFFRATDWGRAVSQKPFLGSAVNNRLHKHLTGAKLNGGETPHMLGCSHDDISRYLGWRSGIWLCIIPGCPIPPVLVLFPPRVPFARPWRLIPATYNVDLNHDISLILPPCIMFHQPPLLFWSSV